MKIDIERVFKLKKELQAIDFADLSKIEWYKNGKKMKIDSKIIDDFRFTGLGSASFITSGFYKKGFEKE